jgi:hypothetical protein
MCRAALWGLAGFMGCAYFAWISFGHVVRNEYDWPHDIWTAITYIVWIILLLALAIDTRCLRERLFFSVLVANFLIGCGTGALWALAALLSLTTLRGAPEIHDTHATSGRF